jgi:hypothetical protein
MVAFLRWLWRVFCAVILTSLTVFGSFVLLVIAFEVQLICLKISAFLPPPPPVVTNVLDVNPGGYHQEWAFLVHSNSWANLASILMLVALILLLVAIRITKSLHASPKTVGISLLVALVSLCIYNVALNKFTVMYDGSFLTHAQGQRFVIGLRETEVMTKYRANDPSGSISTIIDDFPERIDGLWDPSSVQEAFLLLGVLYVLTAVAFAVTLIIAGDLALMAIIEIYKQHSAEKPSVQSKDGGNAALSTERHI